MCFEAWAQQTSYPCPPELLLHRRAPSNGALRFSRCRLSRAQLIEADEHRPQGSCHLDVRFVSVQRHTLVDVLPGATFDLDERLQESTWRFEGVVSDAIDNEVSWRVNEIDWQVWEVKQRESME